MRGLKTTPVRLMWALLLFAGAGWAQRAPAPAWIGTWAASPQAMNESGRAPAPAPDLSGHTVRMIVRLSLGGSQLRVRLSNAFGVSAVTVGAAHIGLADEGSATLEGSDRALSFGGAPGIEIPPGGEVLSDPAMLPVPRLGRVAVSLYLTSDITATSQHSLARATSYVVAGDHTGDGVLAAPDRITHWPLLSGIDVPRLANDAGAIVTLGDSITDGAAATLDQDRRWPDVMAETLGARSKTSWGVLNEGISGNRLLHDNAGPSALARLDRDVLAQDGARVLIVLEGINDIGWPAIPGGAYADQKVSAKEIIAALQQIATRARAHGLAVVGATLTPFGGAFYATPDGAAVREAVNQWIRTGGAFDGVLDFDQITRDPAHPLQYLPACDSGDHLHPNDAGYEAMGAAAAAFLSSHWSPKGIH